MKTACVVIVLVLGVINVAGSLSELSARKPKGKIETAEQRVRWGAVMLLMGAAFTACAAMALWS